MIPCASELPGTLQITPYTRPDSITCQITPDGTITIAADATPDELRSALTALATEVTRLRRLNPSAS